jgi:hypothetical protein
MWFFLAASISFNYSRRRKQTNGPLQRSRKID